MPESLEFSSSIYSPSAIQETVDAYSEILDCEVVITECSIKVQLSPKVDGIENLADHFSNHALHLSIVHNRGGMA